MSHSVPWRIGWALLAVLGVGAIVRGDEPMPADLRIAARPAGQLSLAGDQPLRMPTDVAVDSTGRVYVADGVNNRVVVFDAAGKPGGLISVAGDLALVRPTGLAVDGQDQLWIADTGNRRVVIVAAGGHEVVGILALPQANSDIPVDATDLALTPDGARLYVVDNDNHRLLVRDNRTGDWTTLGRAGSGLGQFQWPFMIAIDGQGRLFVTQVVGARVQRFAANGKAERIIASWGVQIGEFYRPKGIAVDRGGRILAGDSTTGAVQVFTATGEVLGALCGPDGRVMRFAHPMGMAIGPTGLLYVVELRADRVALVSLADSKIAPVIPVTTQPADESR